MYENVVCTCLREGERTKGRRGRSVPGREKIERSNGSQRVGIRLSSCKKRKRRRRGDEDEARRDETRRDRSGREEGEGGERKRERERRRGILEAEPRAYDIKHYNYYLNSSRMAPGVAALLFSLSLLFAFAASHSRSSPFLIIPFPPPTTRPSRQPPPQPSFSLSLSIFPPPPPPPPPRMAAQPRAFCSRIPVAPTYPPCDILLLLELASLSCSARA